MPFGHHDGVTAIAAPARVNLPILPVHERETSAAHAVVQQRLDLGADMLPNGVVLLPNVVDAALPRLLMADQQQAGDLVGIEASAVSRAEALHGEPPDLPKPQIEVHFHGRRLLPVETRDALARMIRLAYEQFSGESSMGGEVRLVQSSEWRQRAETAEAALAAAEARTAAAEQALAAERARAEAAEQALRAADDLARVLDEEVMPRYLELMAALHLGDSVVDPMARQALDAYHDARAILQAADQRGGEAGE